MIWLLVKAFTRMSNIPNLLGLYFNCPSRVSVEPLHRTPSTCAYLYSHSWLFTTYNTDLPLDDATTQTPPLRRCCRCPGRHHGDRHHLAAPVLPHAALPAPGPAPGVLQAAGLRPAAGHAAAHLRRQAHAQGRQPQDHRLQPLCHPVPGGTPQPLPARLLLLFTCLF